MTNRERKESVLENVKDEEREVTCQNDEGKHKKSAFVCVREREERKQIDREECVCEEQRAMFENIFLPLRFSLSLSPQRKPLKIIEKPFRVLSLLSTKLDLIYARASVCVPG